MLLALVVAAAALQVQLLSAAPAPKAAVLFDLFDTGYAPVSLLPEERMRRTNIKWQSHRTIPPKRVL